MLTLYLTKLVFLLTGVTSGHFVSGDIRTVNVCFYSYGIIEGAFLRGRSEKKSIWI